MILFLDTTNLSRLHFTLIDAGQKKIRLMQIKHKISYEETHKILELLAKFLKRHNIKPSDWSKIKDKGSRIIVCSGPGSFTGTRVGVTLAGALGFAWNVPVITIAKNKVPKNLKKLVALKARSKILVRYNRPAV